MDNTDQLEEVVNSITVDSAGQFYTLDELIEKLGIKRPDTRPRRWYRFLPKPFRIRAEKYGIEALQSFTIMWVSIIALMISIPFGIFTDITGNFFGPWANIFIALGVFGGTVGFMFGGVFYASISQNDEKTSSEKKELIYEHCQSMIDDYRNQVMNEDSEMVKTEARLKKDIEKVDRVIEKIESFLTDPKIRLTIAEEKDCQRQLADAKVLKEGREKILEAHSDTKKEFLSYLTSLEKKLSRVDISISLKRVADELNDLEDKTASRISESEQAFMELLTSFAGDIQNLQNAIENLQVFSRASFEVENDSGEPRVLMSKEEEMIDINTFMKNAVSENKVPESVPAS